MKKILLIITLFVALSQTGLSQSRWAHRDSVDALLFKHPSADPTITSNVLFLTANYHTFNYGGNRTIISITSDETPHRLVLLENLSSSFTVTLTDDDDVLDLNGNVILSTNQNILLKANSDGSKWREITRNNLTGGGWDSDSANALRTEWQGDIEDSSKFTVSGDSITPKDNKTVVFKDTTNEFIKLNSLTEGIGDWYWYLSNFYNNVGTTDPNQVFRWGYNINKGGGRLDENYPSIHYAMESRYIAETDTGMEVHLQVTNLDGLENRLFSYGIPYRNQNEIGLNLDADNILVSSRWGSPYFNLDSARIQISAQERVDFKDSVNLNFGASGTGWANINGRLHLQNPSISAEPNLNFVSSTILNLQNASSYNIYDNLGVSTRMIYVGNTNLGVIGSNRLSGMEFQADTNGVYDWKGGASSSTRYMRLSTSGGGYLSVGQDAHNFTGVASIYAGAYISNNTTVSGTSNQVKYYSTDLSAGNTIPSFYTEGTGVISANGNIVNRYNGTVRYIPSFTSEIVGINASGLFPITDATYDLGAWNKKFDSLYVDDAAFTNVPKVNGSDVATVDGFTMQAPIDMNNESITNVLTLNGRNPDNFLANVNEDASPELGGDMNFNQQGLKITVDSVSGNVSADDWIFLSQDSTYWTKTDATDDTEDLTISLCGIYLGNKEVLIGGEFVTSGLTKGATYYLTTTPGVISTVAPSSDGNVERIVGTAKSTTVLVLRDMTGVVISVP